MNRRNGITLIALVIAIVVLLILSAVTISLTLGERGIFNLAQEAGSESNKAEATEKVNLKITQAQMKSYIEKQRLPSLQELADMFNIDNDFEYVHTNKKEIAAVVEPFSIGNSSSIFVKLEHYEYEFEIDSLLRLASIDGVKLADTNYEEKYNLLKEEYETFRSNISVAISNKGVETLPTMANEEILGNISNISQNIGMNYWKRFQTSSYKKNNENATITVSGLTIGKQYCALIGRSTTRRG